MRMTVRPQPAVDHARAANTIERIHHRVIASVSGRPREDPRVDAASGKDPTRRLLRAIELHLIEDVEVGRVGLRIAPDVDVVPLAPARHHRHVGGAAHGDPLRRANLAEQEELLVHVAAVVSARVNARASEAHAIITHAITSDALAQSALEVSEGVRVTRLSGVPIGNDLHAHPALACGYQGISRCPVVDGESRDPNRPTARDTAHTAQEHRADVATILLGEWVVEVGAIARCEVVRRRSDSRSR